MCNPASMIVTRGHKVHWSENTDSHHEIITELGLRETDARGNINIVPVEITPPDDDMTKPLSEWVFSIDTAGFQRDLPDWWDDEKAEAAVRCALKAWKAKKVITRKTKALTVGQYYVCGKATIENVSGNAVVSLRDSAVIKYVGGSAVIKYVRGSAVIQDVRGSAVIKYVRDLAVIIVYTATNPNCLKSTTAVIIDRSIYGKVKVTTGKGAA